MFLYDRLTVLGVWEEFMLWVQLLGLIESMCSGLPFSLCDYFCGSKDINRITCFTPLKPGEIMMQTKLAVAWPPQLNSPNVILHLNI